MSGCFYLLRLSNNKTYSGSTDNLERRISQHRGGKVKSTKNHLPLELIYKKDCKTLKEARHIEKYYKSCIGRKKLKEILKNKM